MFLIRFFLAFIALGSAPSFAFGVGGGGAVPAPCSASAPAQVVAAGLNTLKLCDTLATNKGVDVNNTYLPGFNLYTRSTDYTRFPANTPDEYTNDGTGLVNTTNNTTVTYQLLTTGYQPSAPYYVGEPITGSFYLEIDQKFSRTQPTSNNSWPALWTQGANYALNGSFVPSNWPFVEIDFLECLSVGAGIPCTFNQQLHIWADIGNAGVSQCNYAGGYSGTPPTTTNYHTYGILFLTRADNGGVGKYEFYVDNVVTNTCTYTTGNATCTFGSNGTDKYPNGCANYPLASMENQKTVFIFGGAYQWPVTLRNFHVWQK